MRSDAPTALRQLLDLGEAVAVPGVYDPVTARLVEKAGFSAVYLGGNALGISLAKGQPMLTLTETVEACARIVRTTDLPLIVDAGSGFGTHLHVHRSVWELEQAGAAGLHLDDQPYPKSPNYHRGGGGLADIRTAASKIEVAARARRNDKFCLIARTDAFRVTGSIDELVRRCSAYIQSGADALLLLDVEQQVHIDAVRAAVPGVPLMWIGGVVPPVLPLDRLSALGFSVALYPFNTIAATVEAVTDLWNTVKATGCVPQSEEFLRRMRGDLSVLAGLKTYWDIEDDLKGRESALGQGLPEP
jgi:2-methylisocitrate lyase-like PEP mutase family enzyme